MQETLMRKLHDYMRINNPDMLVKLQAEGKVTSYLQDKLLGIDSLLNELLNAAASPMAIEEVCVNVLTEDLRPSKYNYVSGILLDSFGATYVQWQKDNILLYEVINILHECEAYFKEWGFKENDSENGVLRMSIKAHIRQYLEKKL